MPERDISSLDVMGWGLEAAGKFFRRRTMGGWRKMCVLSINVFFTIGSQNRDLDALLPGNGSELCHASFCFLDKIWISDGKSSLSMGNRNFLEIYCFS